MTQLSQSGWYYGNCVANLVGGLIAYGIGSIDITTIANWQLLFLFLGAITSFIGIVLFILLPDSPAKAIFLNKWQRAVAVQRTVRNKTGVLDTGSFKWEQAWMAVKDPQTWFLILFNFSVNLCNGGITTVSFCIHQSNPLLTVRSSRPLSSTDSDTPSCSPS